MNVRDDVANPGMARDRVLGRSVLEVDRSFAALKRHFRLVKDRG